MPAPRIRIKRGTISQINAAVTANGLLAGEMFLITDQNRIGIGLTTNTYEVYAKVSEASGGSGGAVNGGLSTLTFGVFPGKSITDVVITGQTAIVANSRVKAWMNTTASADHSADEHVLESIKVVAYNIVPGVGFTIRAISTTPAYPMSTYQSQPYGIWNVAWEWI